VVDIQERSWNVAVIGNQRQKIFVETEKFASGAGARSGERDKLSRTGSVGNRSHVGGCNRQGRSQTDLATGIFIRDNKRVVLERLHATRRCSRGGSDSRDLTRVHRTEAGPRR
jgi:hypothetical protein